MNHQNDELSFQRISSQLDDVGSDVSPGSSCNVPTFNLRVAVGAHLAHIVQKLRPSHDVGCLVRCVNVVWARALLWVCAYLFAHFDANTCELLLDHCTILEILIFTSLADGNCRKRSFERLPLLQS